MIYKLERWVPAASGLKNVVTYDKTKNVKLSAMQIAVTDKPAEA